MVMLNRKDWMVIANVATPIPPNTKAVGYPWRDFMIRYVLGVMGGLVVIIIIDVWRRMLMSEKDRFYRKQTKKYKDLKVGFVELKGYEK